MPQPGGLGAHIGATVTVTPGETLDILVGGQGASAGSCTAGGGGGSFIVRAGNTPLVVAGGGGGGFHCNVLGGNPGGPGQVTENGQDGITPPTHPSPYNRPAEPGGTNGNGAASSWGGGGAGFFGNGSSNQNQGGFAYVNGAQGGSPGGGYGGGGSGADNCCAGSGGGGGYSGGGGGQSDGCSGGGGGSYAISVMDIAEAGVRSGNGLVVISFNQIPECNEGCTDPLACNYDDTADVDNGTCVLPDGCTDETACNYDPAATCDDGSCILPDGCTDEAACNFDPNATCDDGSCAFVIDCAGVCGGIFIEDACGNCYDPNGQNGTQEFTYTGGLQTWTVPADVTEIFIEAYGAEGGTANSENGVPQPGGLGAHIGATVTVTPGETLDILVGGQGASAGSCTAGGGGGSFIVRAGNTPLVVAGGGGGGFHCNVLGGNPGGPGQVTENGQDGITPPTHPSPYNRPAEPGGTNGNGAASSWGGGGAGFFGNGSSNQNQGGFAYVNGAQGGSLAVATEEAAVVRTNAARAPVGAVATPVAVAVSLTDAQAAAVAHTPSASWILLKQAYVQVMDL